MTRAAASQAVVALRKALGLTQQRFAVEVLKTAITTIARYETSHPPRGDVLLRLAEIAAQKGLLDIRRQFQVCFLQELEKHLGHGIKVIWPATEAEPKTAVLRVPLAGAGRRGKSGWRECCCWPSREDDDAANASQ